VTYTVRNWKDQRDNSQTGMEPMKGATRRFFLGRRLLARHLLAALVWLLCTGGSIQADDLRAADLRAADPATISGKTPAPNSRWEASSGETSLTFDPGVLESLGLSVEGSKITAIPGQPGEYRLRISPLGRLQFWAPHAAFDGFASGNLQHMGGLSLSFPGGRVSLSDFRLQPSGPDGLNLVDSSGTALLKLDYVHTYLDPQRRELRLQNMDVRITPALAQRLGNPDWTGLVIGRAFTRTNVSIPMGGTVQGLCTSPSWHNGTTQLTDVELTAISAVQQVAREAGVRVAIAPSATLENVGTADVPWYPKFTTTTGETFPAPYGMDQHPFLVWAVYRNSGGVLEQIGVSDVKHAFFAQNNACGCSGGSVLWSANSSPNGVGCNDVYGINTNDNPLYLGLRDEVEPHTGVFQQCGSMFAPGATPPGPCNQTVTGAPADEFARRLVVTESKLQTGGAEYWMDAWYVVRDDVNLFNGMAHVTLAPVLNGSMWNFNPGATIHGGAVDAWVAANTATSTQAHVRAGDSDGHYSLAVRVTSLGGGLYQYVYVLMNYDYEPRFDTLALTVPAGVTVDSFSFFDADGPGANDWTVSQAGGELSWTAPASAELRWGRMNTFKFRANVAPEQGSVSLGLDDPGGEIDVGILSLINPDLVHKDGFEDP